jgi:hypothetical protein
MTLTPVVNHRCTPCHRLDGVQPYLVVHSDCIWDTDLVSACVPARSTQSAGNTLFTNLMMQLSSLHLGSQPAKHVARVLYYTPTSCRLLCLLCQ